MHRQTPLLTTAVLSALALAACQDGAPTAPSPAAGPLAAKGSTAGDNGNKNPLAGLTSSPVGIAPTVVSGNTSGDGNAACAAYGGMGTKVDGNYGQRVAGYDFSVTGGTTLSFSRNSPGYAITAVLVKGGPAYDVYDYSGRNGGTKLGVTADGGLTSPHVGNNKNIPDISHYTVCYVRNIHVTKRLSGVKTSDGHGGMKGDPFYQPGGAVVIPQGETRWLQFEIAYEQAPGSTGTLTEIVPDLCRSAGFSCTSPDFNTSDPNSGKFTVTGSGTKTITLDVTNHDCGSGTLKNRVMFDVPPLWVDASASVEIAGQCVKKRLVDVYSSMGSGGMQHDATFMDGKVTIPRGETRWLDYEISYTLGGNGSGTLSDDVTGAVCAALNSSPFGGGFVCSTAGFDGAGSQSASVSGTGTRHIIIDIKNEHGCGDRDFVNKAVLARSGGPTTSGTSAPVMIWTPKCS